MTTDDTQLNLKKIPAELRAEADAVAADANRIAEIYDARSENVNAAHLATRYEEGDEVDTPDGVGVVTGVLTDDATTDSEDFEDIQASEDSPAYIVVTEADADGGFGVYRASALDATTIETDVDALDSTKDAAAAALSELDPAPEEARLDFDTPPSWRESDTPTRVIALKAYSGMGGSFDGCVREMRGEVADPDAFCGAFLDRVLGYPYWRGDSPLPGD